MRPAEVVGFSGGPFALQRLDEALRFAVGARCVGPRPEVSDSERLDGVSKEPGDEGRAVVRYDAAGADALAAIPGDDPVVHAHAKDVAPLLMGKTRPYGTTDSIHTRGIPRLRMESVVPYQLRFWQ